MRSNSNTCGICDHWHPASNEGAARVGMLAKTKPKGVCYRYPQQLIGLLTPNGNTVVNARPDPPADEPACDEFKYMLQS